MTLGISKKTIYKFFPTKEILIEKYIDHYMVTIENKLKTIINTEENSAIRFVKAIEFTIEQIIRIHVDKTIDISVRYPFIWKKIETFQLKRQKDIISILSDAQKQGYIREDIDTRIASILGIDIIKSTFQSEFFIKNNLAPSNVTRIFVKMITGGLLTKEGMQYFRFYENGH